MALVLVSFVHWIRWFTSFLGVLFLISASVLMLVLGLQLPFESFLASTLIFSSFLGFSLALHWLFVIFLSWKLSRIIMTLHELVSFRYAPFVRHDSAFCQLHNMSSVDRQKHGILSNLFNYGEVHVRFTEVSDPVQFHYVPRPAIFIRALEEIMEHQRTNIASPKE
jgi:hypothetical protein